MTSTLLATMSSGAEGAFIAAYFGVISLFVLAILAFTTVIYWRIASKAGYPGAMSLLMFVPIANFIVLIVFAFGEWPIQRALRAAGGGMLPPAGGSYVPPGGGGYAPTAPAVDPYAQTYRADPPQLPPYGAPPPPPVKPPEPF